MNITKRNSVLALVIADHEVSLEVNEERTSMSYRPNAETIHVYRWLMNPSRL
jgi:hypothetical protein